jgi:hypothetical protein
MDESNVPLGIFKTRLYPYILSIAFLGILSVICLQQWLIPSRNAESAYYSMLLFSASFIAILWALINDYSKLTIYQHKLIKESTFKRSTWDISFHNVEAATIKNRLYRIVSRKGAVSARREVSLKLLMKDGQKIEIDLGKYTDHEIILQVIQNTDLKMKGMFKD